MKSMEELAKHVDLLTGNTLAMRAVLNSVIRAFPIDRLPNVLTQLETELESAYESLTASPSRQGQADALVASGQQWVNTLEQRMKGMGVRRSQS